MDASETIVVDLGVNSEINLEPSTTSNLAQLASLTVNLPCNLPCEEDAAMGAEQMSMLTLENKPFQEKSNITTFTAPRPQSRNEMDLTQTITNNILSVDRTRSLSKKDNPSQSHDETSTTYNILRETTNLDPNQRQSRTVVKRPASTQEKELKASIQSKNPGGTCNSTLSKKSGILGGLGWHKIHSNNLKKSQCRQEGRLPTWWSSALWDIWTHLPRPSPSSWWQTGRTPSPTPSNRWTTRTLTACQPSSIHLNVKAAQEVE